MLLLLLLLSRFSRVRLCDPIDGSPPGSPIPGILQASMKVVDDQLGAVARPARVRFVTVLPKTRSGKLLRRAIQAVCERRDPGDLTTIEDPTALQQITDLVATSA